MTDATASDLGPPVRSSFADILLPVLAVADPLPAHLRRFLIQPRAFLRPPACLTREQAEQDLLWLFDLLPQVYAGWQTFSTQGVVDWMALCACLMARLPGPGGTLMQDGFHQILVDGFATVPDGHLAFSRLLRAGPLQVTQQLRFTYTGSTRLWAHEALPDHTQPPHGWPAGTFPALRWRPEGTLERLSCAIASPEPEKNDDRTGWKPIDRIDAPPQLDPTLPLAICQEAVWYVRAPHFGATLPDFLASGDAIGRHDLVIVDLRGNQGGDESRFGAWLEALGAPTVRYEFGIQTVSRLSRLHQANIACSRVIEAELAHPSQDGQPLAPETAQALAHWREQLTALTDADCELPQTTQHLPWDMGHTAAPRREPFCGQLVVLIDRGTLSAGESAARMARQVPKTLVLGTNTGGKRIISCNGYWYMPHSQVSVFCGTVFTTSLQEDPRYVEGLGVLPDIWCDDLPRDLPGLRAVVSNIVAAHTHCRL